MPGQTGTEVCRLIWAGIYQDDSICAKTDSPAKQDSYYEVSGKTRQCSKACVAMTCFVGFMSERKYRLGNVIKRSMALLLCAAMVLATVSPALVDAAVLPENTHLQEAEAGTGTGTDADTNTDINAGTDTGTGIAVQPDEGQSDFDALSQNKIMEETNQETADKDAEKISENAKKEQADDEKENTDETQTGHKIEEQDLDTISGNGIAESHVVLVSEYHGIKVTVTGPKDGLPEGCSVRISELDSESLMAYAANIYEQEVVEQGHIAFDCLSGYDITLLDSEGNEMEPGQEVQVKLENSVNPDDELSGLGGNDAYEVYHVTDEETTAIEKLVSDMAGKELVFMTDSFSPYIIGRTTYEANENYRADRPYLKSNGASGSQYFPYTGKTVEWTAPQDGLYSLEGIGGGFAGPDGSTYNREEAKVCSMGYGGYSIAYVNLHQGDKLYIAVGGAGSKSTAYSSAPGGWNGGGTGFYSAGSGGGATSFASKLIGDGTLVNYSNDLDSLVAVAGGAGGQSAAVDQKLSLVQLAAMSGLGGGEVLSDLYARIVEDPTVAVYGASKKKYYEFGKGQPSLKAAEIKGLPYAGGAGGGGVYGGFSSSFYGIVERDVKSVFGGTGGTGYINFSTGSKIYALNDDLYSSYTKSEWLESGDQDDLLLGNGEAAINYLGKIQSTVTLNLGNDAIYRTPKGAQKGSVEITGEAGSTIDLSGVTAVEDGSKVIGFNVISGDGRIEAKSMHYTFGEEDTVLIPLIYSEIDLISVKKIGASEFKDYTYNNNALLNWDEAGNNNKKTYYVHQSVDGGDWKQLTLSNYTQLIIPQTEFYYTGSSQRYIVPADGIYYAKLYGAQGGSDGSAIGGLGGYIYGYLNLKKGDVITVNVGGGGRNSTETKPGTLIVSGGWNGGGDCVWSGSGGGRTDIFVNGRLVAAAAGGGGGTNGLKGGDAKKTTDTLYDVNATWQGEGRTSYSSTIGDDRNDAGAGGAGYARGGNYGVNENPKWGGRRSGGGGYNGYDASCFTFVTERGGSFLNGKENSTYNGGFHGYAIIRPEVSYSVYKQKSHLSLTPDKAAPNKPYNGKIVYTDQETNTVKISWSAPQDKGTVYRHKVTAYEITDNNTEGSALGDSDITTDYIVSGVAGYYYYMDENPTGKVTKNHAYTVSPTADGIPASSQTTYLHVAAVDRAGNLGVTYDIPVSAFYAKSGSVTWVDRENAYGLRPEEDVIELYQDGILVDRQTLATDEECVSFTFDHLEYGHEYKVVQQGVSPYDVEQSDWDFVNTLLLHIHKEVRDEGGNDIDGSFVDTGDILEYVIELGQQSDRDRGITVFDQVPAEVEYISGDDGVTVIKTQAERDAYNGKAKEDGHAWVPDRFNLDTPIIAYQYAGALASSDTFSFYVKVKNTAETKHILNQAVEFVDATEPGMPEKLWEISSNQVENIVRFNPLKAVSDMDGKDMNKTSVSLGEVIVYTITFQNAGDEDETATVTDILPQGLAFVEADNGGTYDALNRTITWIVEAKAHALQTVSFQARVLEEGKDIYVRNTAKVDLNKKPKPTQETENLPMGDPEKSVYDSDGRDVDGDVVYAGETLTYTVTYVNDSDESQKYTVTDTLPEQVEIVELLDGGVLKEDGRTVIWTANVASKAQMSVSVRVRVKEIAKGEICRNRATVRTEKLDDPDAVYEKETNEVENPVMPSPVKDVLSSTGVCIDRAVVYEGNRLIYTITYTNPADGEKTFEISDMVPDKTAFVSVGEDGIYDEETGLVTFVRTIAGHETDTVTFTVKVLGEAKDTVIRNKAFVTVKDRSEGQPDVPADPDKPVNPDKPAGPGTPENPVLPSYPENPGKIETNEVINPVIPKPEKKVSAKICYDIDGHPVYAGEELIFEISYKNPASETKHFTVTDQVPEWTKFVSAENDGVYDEETGLVTFERTVEAGKMDTVRFTVLVLEEGKNNLITNKAVVKAIDRPVVKPDGGPASPPDPDEPQDTETNETENPVMPDPVKTVTDQKGEDINGFIVEAGSELIYSISFENPAKQTESFTVKDPLPEGVEFVSADYNGVYDEKTHTVTYTVELSGETSVVVTCTVQVKEATSYTELVNRAEVITDIGKISTNTVENETIVLPKKDVCDADGRSVDGLTVYGDQAVIYEITYTNYTDESRDITIVDAVDRRLKDVGNPADGGISDDGVWKEGVITWELKNVPARYTGKVTFSARTPILDKNVDIPNQAIVTLHGAEIRFGMSDGRKDTGDIERTTNKVLICVSAMPEEDILEALAVEVIDEDMGELLPGNEVTVYHSDGHVIDQWISSKTPHLIENLEAGSYLVRQTTVVDGYVIVVGEKTARVNPQSGTVKVTLIDRMVDEQPAKQEILKRTAPDTGDRDMRMFYLFLSAAALLAFLVTVRIYSRGQRTK